MDLNAKIYWDYLGRTDYKSCFEYQNDIRESILANNYLGYVVLTEHAKTITLGRRETGSNLLYSEEILEKKGFSVNKTTRGGLATYHGPGQLVIYPILNLRRLKLKVKEYVKKLEQSVIGTLQIHGIESGRREGYPGVWIGEKKIGSLGIHVKKLVTMHGFALNVNTDLNDFDVINPCGFKTLEITSMEKEGADVSLENLVADYMKSFDKVFGCKTEKSAFKNYEK